MDCKVEVGAQMAAIAILGDPSWHAPHKFGIVNPWHYITFLDYLFPNPLVKMRTVTKVTLAHTLTQMAPVKLRSKTKRNSNENL